MIESFYNKLGYIYFTLKNKSSGINYINDLVMDLYHPNYFDFTDEINNNNYIN